MLDNEIDLVVTERHLAYAGDTKYQWQITLRNPSAGIRDQIAKLSKANPKILRLGGGFQLVLTNSGGIWRSHNGHQEALFDALYESLKSVPDQPIRFSCELLPTTEQ